MYFTKFLPEILWKGKESFQIDNLLAPKILQYWPKETQTILNMPLNHKIH